jgi:acyl carrier protein
MQLQQVLDLVLEAVAELNQELDEEQQLEVSPETRLLGRSSKLDSLGLVNLIVSVEEKVSDTFGQEVTLADERAMSQERSPFRSVQSLAEYVYSLLNEKDHA